MAKFDTCGYSYYFSEYGGMRKCYFSGIEAEAHCKGCKNYFDPQKAVKACPFCGSKPHVMTDYWTVHKGGDHQIYCHKCNIEMNSHDLLKLIERWNTRKGNSNEKQ